MDPTRLRLMWSANIPAIIVTYGVHTDPRNVEEEEEKTTGTTIRRKGSGDQEAKRNSYTKEHQKDRAPLERQ